MTEATEYLVHCPVCGLIFRPDPQVFVDGGSRCHKCGADFTQPPAWKEVGQDGEKR